MRPRVLTLTAFGPYPSTEVVDFRPLRGHDLFLIDGPTGAGKTAILDAMTFALYGVVPGARGELKDEELRSRWAEPSARCEVRFEFELGERVYRAERVPAQRRQKKRGQGTTEERAEARLLEVTGVGDRLLASGRVAEVTEAVERLLGLTADQFTQVLVLPQGDFRQFLLATSAEKETLLERLFAASIYKEAGRLLMQERTALERRASELARFIGEMLAQRGVASAAALADRVAGARARAGVLATAAEEGAGRTRAARAAHERAVRAAAKRAERQRLAEERRRLDDEAPGVNGARGLLARAVRAAPLVEPRARAEAARAEAGKRAAERAERAAALARARVELDRRREAVGAVGEIKGRIDGWAREAAELERLAQVEAEAARAEGDVARADKDAERLGRDHAARSRDRDELATRRRAAETAVADAPALAARAAEAMARLARRRALVDARVAATAAAVALERARARAQEARRGAAAAQEALAVARAEREAGLAGELAARLVGGEPCPVCGAREHPAPAGGRPVRTVDIGAFERAADDAGAALVAAERDEATAAERAGAARAAERAAELGDDVERDERALAAEAEDASRAATAAEQAAAAVAALGAAHERAVEVVAALEAPLAAAREQRAVARAVRDERRAQLAGGKGFAARAHAVAKQRSAAESDVESRLAALARAEAGLAGADAALAAAGRAADIATDEAERRSEELAAAAARQGFASADEATAAHLAPDVHERLRGRVDGWERRASEVAGRLAELARDVDADDPGDPTALAAAAEAAEAEARVAQEQLGEARGQLAELVRTEELVAEKAAEQARAEAALRVWGHLARVVGGDNARKMSLARYVLASRMDEVAVAASARLLRMSGGRYTLRRSEGVYDARRGAGLDLLVEDRHTGADRPVHSLSGGEMFLCSLCLAMGLADSVQAHAGGVRLGSLFIDEGFGTLDDETLDQVVRTLEDLRSGGRLVGLISHVGELRERLPARISVSKGLRGSTTRLWS